jgi:hypothetical protein
MDRGFGFDRVETDSLAIPKVKRARDGARRVAGRAGLAGSSEGFEI